MRSAPAWKGQVIEICVTEITKCCITGTFLGNTGVPYEAYFDPRDEWNSNLPVDLKIGDHIKGVVDEIYGNVDVYLNYQKMIEREKEQKRTDEDMKHCHWQCDTIPSLELSVNQSIKEQEAQKEFFHVPVKGYMTYIKEADKYLFVTENSLMISAKDTEIIDDEKEYYAMWCFAYASGYLSECQSIWNDEYKSEINWKFEDIVPEEGKGKYNLSQHLLRKEFETGHVLVKYNSTHKQYQIYHQDNQMHEIAEDSLILIGAPALYIEHTKFSAGNHSSRKSDKTNKTMLYLENPFYYNRIAFNKKIDDYNFELLHELMIYGILANNLKAEECAQYNMLCREVYADFLEKQEMAEDYISERAKEQIEIEFAAKLCYYINSNGNVLLSGYKEHGFYNANEQDVIYVDYQESVKIEQVRKKQLADEMAYLRKKDLQKYLRDRYDAYPGQRVEAQYGYDDDAIESSPEYWEDIYDGVDD